jgi:hypothetical protein
MSSDMRESSCVAREGTGIFFEEESLSCCSAFYIFPSLSSEGYDDLRHIHAVPVRVGEAVNTALQFRDANWISMRPNPQYLTLHR